MRLLVIYKFKLLLCSIINWSGLYNCVCFTV